MKIQNITNLNPQKIIEKNKKYNRKCAPVLDKTNTGMLLITYSRPVTLKQALLDTIETKELECGLAGEKDIVSRFIKDLSRKKDTNKILKRKVTKLSGYGTSAMVFDTADGKVIKLTNGNHFPLNRPIEIFDVPVYLHGKSRKTHFYVEEKLFQHDMPVYWVNTVKDMIKSAGYKAYDFFDYDTHQIGISKNGRLYLLDPECARYKTVFNALFDKVLRLLKK